MKAASRTVTSAANRTLKAVRKLKMRKAREETGLCLIEGSRLVSEAVKANAVLETLVVAPPLLRPEARRLWRGLANRGVLCLEVTEEAFSTLAEKDDFDGMAAAVRQRWSRLDSVNLDCGLCWLALQGIQFPGNLGTILRTSDAVGCSGAILLGWTTDPYHPAAIRASRGAVFTQTLVRAQPEEFLSWARVHDATLVGTSPSGTADFRHVQPGRRLVLLMGSEHQGLPCDLLEECHWKVRIPMVGRDDSLNVAVATGIVLYELFDRATAFR